MRLVFKPPLVDSHHTPPPKKPRLDSRTNLIKTGDFLLFGRLNLIGFGVVELEIEHKLWGLGF